MTPLSETIVRERVKQYFNIKELVGPSVYKKYGERAWRFLDYRLLYAMLIVREGIGKSMYVNRGSMKQRGLRSIRQQILKNMFRLGRLYLSAHMLGKGVDFDIKGMKAQEVRDWIMANEDLFPFKIRIEKGVSWVHMDVIYEEHNPKVYAFNP